MAETTANSVVGYVLKGFPRRSELFIASEIHRLEQTGLELRLFVIKAADEAVTHDVVGRIHARPEYLPPATSLSGVGLKQWLRGNLPQFAPALRRTARRHPIGLAHAAALACAQAVRARRGFLAAPRALYLKELLQAVALADQLANGPRVRHLHGHFAHGATTVTWLASVITGIPFSFTGHAKDIYEPSLNPAGLLPRKLRAARFVVTCTEANRAHLLTLAPDARVHRVYHGLNADFAELLNGNGASTEGRDEAEPKLRLLSIGRLVEKKGFDILVDATAVIAARGVPVETRIVGEDGDAAEGLRDRIERLGLSDRVTLVGPLGQAAIHAELGRASAFCLPCRVLDSGDRDGIPNVLVEAMAAGAPVITTNVSGIPELVQDGENGVLIPPGDANRLAESVLRLHRAPALAASLGAAGRRTVAERFDGNALAGTLHALFEAPA
jgi:glycosyltransferase involved in cell wall biosynthesis